MEEEVWKPFRDTRYDVSNKGRVRSTERPDESGNIRKNQAGIMHQKVTKDGYAEVGIRGRSLRVHRMVAELFVDNDKHPNMDFSELVVDHIDNNRLNNGSENLQWLTNSENIKKAFDDGLFPEKSEAHKKNMSDRFKLINERHKKEIIVTNKLSNEKNTFGSAIEASRNFGYADGYFSDLITKRGGENPYWKAEYIQERNQHGNI